MEENRLAKTDVRVMCIVKRWEHVSPSGGYEQLAAAVGSQVIRRRLSRNIFHRFKSGLWWRLASPKPYLLDYRYEDWAAELQVLCRSHIQKLDVIHILNGDEQLDLLLRRRSLLSSPLVASFHLPAHRVSDRFEKIQKHLLSGLDLAVVVAKCQLAAFRSWLGPDRVVYVPHGIDTNKFCPNGEVPLRNSLRLMTVGNHMRDWRVLDEVICRCHALQLPVEFDIVTSDHGLSRANGFPNVRLHCGISEEALIRMYREADALLLPLQDATANNSILEAMACGLPVISSSVGGIPDYVDETSGWLFETGEVARIMGLIHSGCSNRLVLSGMRRGRASKGAIVQLGARCVKNARGLCRSCRRPQGSRRGG